VLRVLLIHNRYRDEAGEERAVSQIAVLLAERGHQVERIERSSAGLARSRAAYSLVRGGVDPEEIASAVRRSGADVVHAHNLHPLFGWRALAAAREAGARTILHLHNYRLFCAVYSCYRDGAPCFECHGSNTLPGVAHRCRGSIGEAVAYGAGLHLQQRHIYEHADRLVAVSEAARKRLVGLGMPAAKAIALPHFIPAAQVAASSQADRGTYVLAAGRLVAEKGFETAIAAAREARVPLKIAGTGPDEPRLRALAQDGGVTFTGWLSAEELRHVRAGAGAVLVPSRWEEPFGYVALDALAAGVPVLASDRGGLAEVVGPDSTVPAEDPRAWARALGELWSDPEARRTRGEAGLQRVRERFTENRYYNDLLALYKRD